MQKNELNREKISFLVLDYKKPIEARKCLESIRANAKFPHQIIYFDNGSNEDYPYFFKKSGLCDILISRAQNNGGGFAQTDLFRFCDTKYAFFVQCDQILLYPLEQTHINTFISKIENEDYKYVDLNGSQAGIGNWTDRAHFIDVEFFNSLAPFPNGGPGPFDHLQYNENHLQNAFKKNNYKILKISPVLFADNGVFTIREVAGGLVKMRTDTKEVKWVKTPTSKYVFPRMTDEEWNLAISGNWPDKKIPEYYLNEKSSFNCWGDRVW